MLVCLFYFSQQGAPGINAMQVIINERPDNGDNFPIQCEQAQVRMKNRNLGSQRTI